MKRIYVAGPMTGLPELNFPAFHAATATLRAMGHEVVNPAEINADLKQLVDCDAVFMLPGWENSRGARLEHAVACGLGLGCIYADGAACWQRRELNEGV